MASCSLGRMKTSKIVATLAISSVALIGAASSPAHAEPPTPSSGADRLERATTPLTEAVTVDGVDYPVCVVEDCSDQAGQIGVWFNSEGRAWLSLGEKSISVVQNGLG